MTDQPHNLKDLEGLDGAPLGCYVQGKFYKAAQLSMADYVDCALWRDTLAIEKIFAAAPQNFRPDTSDIKAQAIARLADNPVDPLKLLTDARCYERLAFYCLKRGGEYPGPRDDSGIMFFIQNLDRRGNEELRDMIWRCSGFTVTKKSEQGDANATGNPPGGSETLSTGRPSPTGL
jgi:hypothetical protein